MKDEYAAWCWTGFSRSAVATNFSWWFAARLLFDSRRKPGFEPALIFRELGLGLSQARLKPAGASSMQPSTTGWKPVARAGRLKPTSGPGRVAKPVKGGRDSGSN
jgi:hypothetical protein